MKSGSVFKFVVSLSVVFLAAAISSLAMRSSETWDWYNQLNKPSFMPPSWLFGPVWTILYILIASAGFLVWEKGLQDKKVKIALLVFLVQLVLNVLWTPLFFGMKLLLIALIEIVILWITIAITIVLFRKISLTASVFMLPYLLWVSFAVLLNASIYNLNL